MLRHLRLSIAAAALLLMGATPLAAQIREIDPNEAIDADLAPGYDPQAETQNQNPPSYTYDDPAVPADPVVPQDQQAQQQQEQQPYEQQQEQAVTVPPAPGSTLPQPSIDGQYTATADANTYKRDDLINAAEGVFGKGAEGLAGIIEDILSDQGEPNAYIAGQEASGAFVVGLRYGSGTMFHKIEGQRPVYWTGPSVGFDVGGDANKTFVLVYNLYDSQELYKRFPAAEGRVYFVGGFAASYMRSGDTVLIPIRMGVGWRLGANVGYMKFSEKQKWLPF
ncbi:DUF1134 domain-containing protein [Sphingomonas gilva]|uniref:DUF1134 domain-containing protein n=1 Tax=Sphingomonas gilva TaxID=2305907 RepID=A0A396RKT8_9SPHN|nr:DUF1134 domain-containing protein [Sphingomonas gilva]RHW16840.1 DUF1134 domain-containing protein [Sphingomonas gilva]